MQVIENEGKQIKAWIDGIELENEAREQLLDIAKLKFLSAPVVVMPDVHAGKGSTIGTVIATRGAIIPSAVGVDIGCGMMAAKLPFKIDYINDLSKLRTAIERVVPVGYAYHRMDELPDFHPSELSLINSKEGINHKKVLVQTGTLGGGNHFIEVCFDEEGTAWIVLHSGSRHAGKTLAEKHIDKAKGLMKQYFIDIPHPDLSYLVQNTPEFDAYIEDLLWAQEYAAMNRRVMMRRILQVICQHVFGEIRNIENECSYINCHHNYSRMENHFGHNMWVTRKGALSARRGEMGIIPGSMGAATYIVEGKGNLESLYSCSHGAGRRMSRTKAKLTYTEKDLELATSGVECRKDVGVIDEIPFAYKDIERVMDAQKDLVTLVHRLNQIICIKG